jgi:hypothetical protein
MLYAIVVSHLQCEEGGFDFGVKKIEQLGG